MLALGNFCVSGSSSPSPDVPLAGRQRSGKVSLLYWYDWWYETKVFATGKNVRFVPYFITYKVKSSMPLTEIAFFLQFMHTLAITFVATLHKFLRTITDIVG